jgi:hypothetical protein
MSEIAIEFLMGPDRSSRLISWFGQGPDGVSHSASLLKDGRYLDARNDVLNGVPSGVHIRDPKTEKWIRKRRATLEVTDEEYQTWEDSLRLKIGDQYGRSDIMEFMFDRGKHQPGHYICSALAINAVQHVSRVHWKPGHLGFIPFPLPIPAHQISPNAALLIVATAGFTVSDWIYPDEAVPHTPPQV